MNRWGFYALIDSTSALWFSASVLCAILELVRCRYCAPLFRPHY